MYGLFPEKLPHRKGYITTAMERLEWKCGYWPKVRTS